MINQIKLENFGPLYEINWSELGRINLIAGGNDSGKTFLLKAIYCSLRTLETYKRGDDKRSVSRILADKLYWTYQTGSIGDLVRTGSLLPLFSSLTIDGKEFSYSYGKDTNKRITKLDNHVNHFSSNSVFLPTKEVLSLYQVILKSRYNDYAFGFDDTHFDLAKLLLISYKKFNGYNQFDILRNELSSIMGGVIEYDEPSNSWVFIKDNRKFSMNVTSEGIKKIAIFDILLSTRYLDTNSVVFIDEIEANLSENATSKLLDVVAILAERGLQFFISSKSYFVIEKLSTVAQERGWSIPSLSM